LDLGLSFGGPGNLNGVSNLIQHDPAMLVAIVMWCLFSIYWEVEAKRASAAAVRESRGSRLFHLVLLNAGQLLLFVSVPGLTGRYLPQSVITLAIGLALETAGVAFAVWARRCLGREWSGNITIKVDHKLIRTGPYRWVRHPIYTGYLAMYAGTAIVSGEWHALLGLGLALVAYARKIPLEEANLLRGFGADYAAYRGETKALIPGVY
jgi:protein-S-isoprenylcysteine O-methyltransferase Ste14